MSYEDRKSTWNSGVRKAMRRGSAEEEVHKHWNRVTEAWKQISKQRFGRRVDVSYDPSMVAALQHGTWMDQGGFKKICMKQRKKRGGIHQPLYGTWVADLMLRQDTGRFMLGKYLSDKKILWQPRRQLGMVVAGNTPTASFLIKIGKEQAQDIKVTTPIKKGQETRYNFYSVSLFVSRFWGRRSDGITINEALQIAYILEFKRSTDRDEGFLEVKEAEANEQHESIIGALGAAAPTLEFEQINFVVGNRGSVVKSDFYTKLESLMYKTEKKTSSSPIR